MGDGTGSTERGSEILLLAKRFLAGQSGVIATARALAPFRHGATSELGEILLIFTGIDSETDSLPVGRVREYWNPESLQRKDQEIAQAEDFYRSAAVDAATRLVRLLERPQ
jgi:hypothetical protein